jgi:serine/threonine-protein kinase
MGVVYKALDRELGRPVAIKLVREDLSHKPNMQVRFRREVELARLVSHPNVCRVHDLGQAEGTLYLSMEYLEGHTLADLISEVGRLSPRQTLDFAEQICEGLRAIHSQDIVHRDLKPTNIGITPSGRVVVMDFGIARRELDLEVTGPGMMIGTYSHLAPEQIPGGKVDERTDIYCLGLLLYEMLTGLRPPGDEEKTPLAFRGKHAQCPPPSHHEVEVRPELDKLVMKCLSWQPDDRPQTVAEVQANIRKHRELLGRETGSREKTAERQPIAWKRIKQSAIVIGIVALATLGVWYAWQELNPIPEVVSTSIRPVAVLPLELEGSQPEYSYLANMTSEALMAGLQSVPTLSVPPYDTIQSFANAGRIQDRPLDDVTRELGVDEVVHGKVSVEAERFKVDLWLTTADGDNVWEASREGSLARPLQTMEWLKSALLEHLEVDSTAASLIQVRTPSVEAYQTYLEGIEAYDKWDIEEQLERAVELLGEAIQLDPDFAAAHALLAKVLVTQFYQTYDPALMVEAAREVKIAKDLAPNLPEVLVAAGFVEEVRGNSVEAEMAYKRAIELAPGNDNAYRVMAYFYSDLGRHQEARAAYQKALTLRPGLWINHYDFGRYLQYKRSEVDLARHHFEKAVEYHPNGVGPTVALGNTYLSEGKLDEAGTWYRKALVHQKSPWAHYNLGVVYYYRAEYELAHRSFEAALERLPNRPGFEVAAGDALRQLGQAEEARAYYDRALATYRRLLDDQPNIDENRIAIAVLLATLDRCDESRQELETVLSRSPESANFAAKGAFASIMCGDRDEATRLALVAIRGGDYLNARFDPELEPVRETPEVRQALENAGLPLQ